MKKQVSSSLMTVPAPCGLAVTSVTGDNEYLYAWQPDRKTVYKMDACGRILCIFKLSRRYSTLHYCGNRRFYAPVEGERRRIYVLNSCFKEIGSIEPDFDVRDPNPNSCRRVEHRVFVGGAGDCRDNNCMLTAATLTDCYAITPSGRILDKLSTAGRGSFYTAVCENNGILYEATECGSSRSNCVRATLLSTGDTKTQRLPYGFKVRSFFCFNGYLYAYITKNSYHGYIAAVCTFPNNGYIVGDILDLPEDGCECGSCAEDSCRGMGSCSCGVSCTSVSTVQTELCDNPVSGDSTEKDCDVDELCRLYHCLKKLCRNGRPSFGCGNGGACGGSCSSCGGSCGGSGGCGHHRPGHRPPPSGDNVFEFDAEYDGACCSEGTLSCSCYRRCRCNENEADDDNTCLPLPCPDRYPCAPCPPCNESGNTGSGGAGSVRPCGTENVRVNYSCKDVR